MAFRDTQVNSKTATTGWGSCWITSPGESLQHWWPDSHPLQLFFEDCVPFSKVWNCSPRYPKRAFDTKCLRAIIPVFWGLTNPHLPWSNDLWPRADLFETRQLPKIGISKKKKEMQLFPSKTALSTSFGIFVVTYRVNNFLPKLVDMLFFYRINWISIFGVPLFGNWFEALSFQCYSNQ